MRTPGSSSEGYCRGLEALVETAKPYRGGEVGYSVFHAYSLLRKLCDDPKPLGRPKITRLLNLGESSVKTLLKRLREVGLVVEERKGHRATREGCMTASYVSGHVKTFHLAAHDIGLRELTEWGEIALILASGIEPPRDLVSVYDLRDQLILDTCKTSIIGGVNRGVYAFPGLPEEISTKLSQVLEELGVKLERGIIVLVKRQDLPKAFSSIIRVLHNSVCRPPS